MPAQDTSKIKEIMLSVLRQRGPSLPVHLTKGTGLSILFASAFLSELLSERKIKMSNMRVGSSPIYYIPGQESKLEPFSIHLNSKEKEAFSILQNKKILKDIEQDPAIRVALRSIKDFAIPFKQEEEIFWRYYLAPETLAKTPQSIQSKHIQTKKETKKPEQKKELEIFDKPKPASKPKTAKPKEKSEFVIEIINSLKESDIELIEEREFKKREFAGVGKIKTNIGSMEIMIIAKDKKTITENDLTVSIQKSQTEKKMILFISPGKLDKKATELLQKYKNILKFVKYNRKP